VTELDRAGLRRALRRRYPWLDAEDIGPRAVTAGECDGCGAEPRMVQPCGPPPAGRAVGPDWALGIRCALGAGVDGWCSGHEEQAEAALARLALLPPEADMVARLWWVATGEVRMDPAQRDQASAVVAALHAGRDVVGIE
jgi:hypothetical protein